MTTLLFSRKALAHLGAGAAAALALSACSSSGPSPSGSGSGTTAGEVKKGGVLRIGTSNGIDSMNPFVGINQDGYSVWMQIYPSLLQQDSTKPGAPYMGSLAEKWEFSADHKTLTFTVRSGAKWSDGQPLDSADVLWSYQMLIKYADGPAGNWGVGDNVKGVSAPSPTTFVVTYAEPTATALYDLGTTPIFPQQVWEKYAVGDGKALKTYNNEPTEKEPFVSGGPFTLTQFKKGDLAIFKKNPNWYGAQPHIDGWGLQTFKNEDALIAALMGGEIDAMGGVPPTSLKAVQDKGLVVDEGPALAMRDLIINSNPQKPKHKELLKPDVKKALELAIDRDEIVKTAWLGKAQPGTTIITPVTESDGIVWHNANVKSIGFDIAEANRLLDAAGYPKGGDGIRTADGAPMSYEVIFADDESGAGDRAFQIIKEGFSKIGVAISQKKLDSSASWDAIYCGEDCEYRDFDLAMWDWFPAADPQFMLSAMTCGSWGDWNDSGYCNPAYDALNDQQKKATDPQERKKIVDQMQQIVYDDRPYVILTYDVRIDAWSPKWEGFVESPQGFFNNWSTQTLEQVHQK